MQHVESWISCACAWFVLVYTKVIPLFLYFVFRIPWVPPFSWIVSLDATCPPPVGPTSIGGLASDPYLLETPHPLLYRATRVISLFMFHTQSSLTMVFNLRKLSPLYSCSHKPLLWYCLFCFFCLWKNIILHGRLPGLPGSWYTTVSSMETTGHMPAFPCRMLSNTECMNQRVGRLSM